MNHIKTLIYILGEICPYAEASRKHPIFSLNATLTFRLTQSFIVSVGGQLLAKKGQIQKGMNLYWE